MTLLQKLKYTRVVLFNLYYSWTLPNYALRMAADSSVGFFLRYNNPKIYKRYYMEYSGAGSDVAETIDSIIANDIWE